MNRLLMFVFSRKAVKSEAYEASEIHAVRPFFCFLFVFFPLGCVQRELRIYAGKFGDRLGPFGDGVFGQFARQDQSNGRLDFSRRHGRLLVVSGQLGGFSRDLFEDVVDEGVHRAHRLGGDTGVRCTCFKTL